VQATNRPTIISKITYKAQAILNLAQRSFILFNIDKVFGRWRMTQTQMTAYLADKIGITKRQAKSALDELNELVTRQLKKEGLLRLAGLGVFRKRKLKARVGRNPATGEQIKIPARTRLRFTPAKALKDSVLGAH
jgi:DNA-binding protein HU-beta